MKTNLDITELLEHFRDDQDVMLSTRKEYYNVIRLFFAFIELEGWDWRQLGIAHIIKFKDKLYDKNKTDRTIRLYMVVIKIFFKWLETNGIYKNIAAGIRLPRKENSFSKKPLTATQMHTFLSSIDRETLIGKRDYALFVLLFTTGLRSISVESADIGDIVEYQGQQVLWYRNKGSRSKNKFKPLTEKCIEAIQDYLLERADFQEHWPLFATHASNRKGKRLTRRTMRQIFKKRLKQIGIDDKRITLHSTRHTHGALSTKFVGAYETQLSLGHKSAQTTRIYNSGSDEEIILENKTGKMIDDLL